MHSITKASALTCLVTCADAQGAEVVQTRSVEEHLASLPEVDRRLEERYAERQRRHAMQASTAPPPPSSDVSDVDAEELREHAALDDADTDAGEDDFEIETCPVNFKVPLAHAYARRSSCCCMALQDKVE